MYKLELIHDKNCQRLEVGFLEGVTATNEELVKYVGERLPRLIEDESMAGRLLKINGSQSLPIAYHIAHKVAHLYGAIAVFDPKLSGYVVSISHDPGYKLGLVLSDEPIII
ncbi:CRISPR-associated protein Csx3 [Nostoc sp. FACHB-110]|uniref:CRISPR-associated protein Csx3 n=1 Tax=Nostoc sp. FACHB-110 TaxID=2692834 RepID=UPI0016865268|nr:CRISPR-associated protein Csx3 [Nostoc sp. FACHB-110]MBD2437404.1 CRISPR-associated protein Csx3 [Nostoc sp. FACHB-110]